MSRWCHDRAAPRRRRRMSRINAAQVAVMTRLILHTRHRQLVARAIPRISFWAYAPTATGWSCIATAV
jgi:hypothetical protein